MSRARDRADGDFAGKELIFDADGDTSITADTDDQIDIRIAGADDFAFKANKFEVQTGSNIDMNGTELILDADGDTSITADTDDQVDIKTAGTDRVSIDSSGFIKHFFTSNNSTTAEGLFINNRQNTTGNNASLILSNDSGGRKKAAIAHIDTGSYGAGDLVFALDGADSGAVHLTNDEKMRITSEGIVTMPKQPCFRAQRQNASGTTQGFTSTITFNREVIDLNADYDTSNGRFTAPVDGTYYFTHGGLGASGSSASVHNTGASWHLEYLKNGSRTGFQYYWYGGNPSAGGNQGWYVNSYLDLIITLSAGDYIQVQLPDGTDSYYSDTSTYYEAFFQGFLVG